MKNSALNPAAARLAARDTSPFSQARLDHLIDEMIDVYVIWRESCVAVTTSYENWSRAGRDDRELAFSAYVAALDREERAAAIYQDLAQRVALT
jgi:hypothetical protein